MRKSIDVFLQGNGVSDIIVVAVDPETTIAKLLDKLDRGTTADEGLLVFVEDVAGPLDLDAVVEELLPLTTDEDSAAAPVRLHFARCRRVDVTVRFNGEETKRHFPPSATIARVHHWATRHGFELSPRDAAEHVLQLQNSTQRPDRDVHIGTLTGDETCAVAFDLVPRKRVEG